MAKTYLDRSEVLKKIGYVARSWGIFESTRKALAEKIKAIPAADVEPVKHGRWENIGGDEWCCNCCGYVKTTDPHINFAPIAVREWTVKSNGNKELHHQNIRCPDRGRDTGNTRYARSEEDNARIRR